jgi:signal transduction histidine kinase
MTMLILFVILWVFAAILIYLNPKDEGIRWASMVAIFGSLGGIGIVLEKNILPIVHGILLRPFLFINGLLFSLSHYVGPYTVIIFGIIYSGLFKFRLKQKFFLFLTLLIPVVYMFLTYPFYPKFTTSYLALNFWVVPYITGGNIFLLCGYWKAPNPILKQQKLLALLLTAPPTMFAMYVNYICPLLGIANAFYYNLIFVVLLFILFITFAARYGVLGVKVKFEKHQIADTMKAVASGTSLLNHAIKNELVKINLCAENLKAVVGADPNGIEYLKFIVESAQHLLKITTRVQEKTQEISLIEQANDIICLIERALFICKPLLEQKKIQVLRDYHIHVIIICDQVHIEETLCNIIGNSIEAMDHNGILNISLFKNKTGLLITIQDNGAGISEANLPHVIEPFFSTKPKQINYGLGLTYCYNVMQKHKGVIEIDSKENHGTIVSLKFPFSKVIKITSSSMPHAGELISINEGVSNGQNQNLAGG